MHVLDFLPSTPLRRHGFCVYELNEPPRSGPGAKKKVLETVLKIVLKIVLKTVLKIDLETVLKTTFIIALLMTVLKAVLPGIPSFLVQITFSMPGTPFFSP